MLLLIKKIYSLNNEIIKYNNFLLDINSKIENYRSRLELYKKILYNISETYEFVDIFYNDGENDYLTEIDFSDFLPKKIKIKYDILKKEISCLEITIETLHNRKLDYSMTNNLIEDEIIDIVDNIYIDIPKKIDLHFLLQLIRLPIESTKLYTHQNIELFIKKNINNSIIINIIKQNATKYNRQNLLCIISENKFKIFFNQK